MDYDYIRKQCENIKATCDPFIKNVHTYMLNTNWTWRDCQKPPCEDEIRNQFYSLLDQMCEGKFICVRTGGFMISINKDTETVKCAFGKYGDIITLDTPEIKKDVDFYKFIDYLCDQNHILNKEALTNMYNQWLKNNF